MIFSLTCLSKDNSESRIRPKCFCPFTFDTTVPLKKEGGGMDFFSYRKIIARSLAYKDQG